MTKSSIQNILIGLDLSSADEAILSFLRQNREILNSENVHFIHVKENDASDSDSGSLGMKKEETEKLLTKRIENSIPNKINYDVQLISGEPGKVIRNYIRTHESDLLVLGHKLTKKHEVEPNKLVKESACSLLLIPEKDEFNIKKVGVALDFSELSLRALRDAHHIAKSVGAELFGIHTFQVPSGYHKSGKDHKEFAKVMEGHARSDAEAFLKKSGIREIEMVYLYDENKRPSECISNYTKENAIDLLVMGSKGRTGAASVLIGSVAKNLSKKLYEIPLVIIKDKNKSMDFLDALKKI